MKKYFRILIAMLTIFYLFTSTALCENIDLSSMTLDELFALRLRLNSEIDSRYVDDIAIYDGRYVVGKDIKAGFYLIYNDLTYRDYITIVITYPSETGDTKIVEYLTNEHPYYLRLEDGCVMEISDAISAHIEMISPPDWAP